MMPAKHSTPYPTNRKGSTPLVERVCRHCGALFSSRQRRIDLGWGRYCSQTCYHDSLRANPLPLADRFWPKVQITPECWLWLGALHNDGYGYVSWEGRMLLAHRASYMLHFGDIPAGLGVLHHCDTPPCTNPEHLFLGTQFDNIRDMAAKGRGRTSDKRGERSATAKLTEEHVREMRRLYAEGHGPTALAARFGVHVGTVNGIVHRLRWKHVA